MHVIILAAGQGRRMSTLTEKIPKPLLLINDESIIERLVRQLRDLGLDDITVVVGYKKEYILNRLNNCFNNIKFVINNKFKDDINIYSLYLALLKNITPFYLFEADCVFEAAALELILNPALSDKSVWFSHGPFKPSQNGGIIKADDNNKVVDIKIVTDYDRRYNDYMKMIGVLKVGEGEILEYATLIKLSCQNNINQYYHMPWIENQQRLESYLVDFQGKKVTSINTVNDYYMAKDLFSV